MTRSAAPRPANPDGLPTRKHSRDRNNTAGRAWYKAKTNKLRKQRLLEKRRLEVYRELGIDAKETEDEGLVGERRERDKGKGRKRFGLGKEEERRRPRLFEKEAEEGAAVRKEREEQRRLKEEKYERDRLRREEQLRKRKERSRQYKKRNSRGQPLMKYRIEAALDKLVKSRKEEMEGE